MYLKQFIESHKEKWKSDKIPPVLNEVQRLSHKCLNLKDLSDFYNTVVYPIDPNMTTKDVADKLFKPYTFKKDCCIMDLLRPGIYVEELTAFISHANNNKFVLLLNTLNAHFKDAVPSEVYVYIDIFTINQNKVVEDLKDGQTLKATIECSRSILVVLDEKAIPLTRLWCLFEIGSTPIDKLSLLTHGFDSSKLAHAYQIIDASEADCWAQTDKDMIRRKVLEMMISQKVVAEGSSINEGLAAFTRVLKLLMILKPISYSSDIEALLHPPLQQQEGISSTFHIKTDYLQQVEDACMGEGRLLRIVGGPGEGKSTLSAAIVKTIKAVDAYHFCKKADVRRQDKATIIRSLSHQLAIRHKDFSDCLLKLTTSEVESLEDVKVAWKLLIENPLKAAKSLKATILIDALDESSNDSFAVGPVVFMLLEMHTICNNLNFIVTTRPDVKVILDALDSRWKDKVVTFSPATLRGEDPSAAIPLMQLLTSLIPPGALSSGPAPTDLRSAYRVIFPLFVLDEHRGVLEVVLASYQPQSLSDLKAMDLLEKVRNLPGYGKLFTERDNKLHMLHRSIAEYLIYFGVDIRNGHMRLADYIWSKVLQPWLTTVSCLSFKDDMTTTATQKNYDILLQMNAYSLRYAVDHLIEVGRWDYIGELVFRLPWLQAVLKELGLTSLFRMIESLSTITADVGLNACVKKLLSILRLSIPALGGYDGWIILPAQIFGRLRGNDLD